MALFLFLLLAALLYTLWHCLVFVRRYPPGPFPLPIVGNLLQMPSKDLHIYFDALTAKYGPIYTLYLPTPQVVFTRYEDIRRLLIAKGTEFANVGPQFDLLAGIPNGGIISANGESWKAQRRISLKILHDFGMGKVLMEDRIMTAAHTLINSLDSLENKASVDLFIPFQLCLGNVINTILFGYAVGAESGGGDGGGSEEKMLHFLEIITHFFTNFMAREMVIYNSWPWTRRIPLLNRAYKRAEAEMRTYFSFIKAEVDGEIARSIAGSSSTTTTCTFIQAYLKEMSGGKNPCLSVEQLYCVVSDFWLAGMETTITLLRWAILYLIEFSYAQERAHEEIDRELGRERFVTMEDRPRLPYLNALLLEAGRFSVLGTTLFRVCGTTQRIGDWEVPPNTDYMFHVYSDNMSYTSGEYDPAEFRPERYLCQGETGWKLNKEASDRFTGFGMGKRQCVGEGLARMELFLILTTLLQRYEFRLAEGLDKVDLSYTYGLIIYPKNQPVGIVKRT